MLDNLSEGSDLTVEQAVEQLQSARSEEEQSAEPEETGSTDEEVIENENAEEEGGDDIDSESSEEETDEDTQEPELYTVKVGGKEKRVAFNDLLENYSKGEDYTNKTMALAEERKSLLAEKAQTQAEVQKFQAITQQLEQMIGDQDAAVDWDELRDTDPSEYLRQRELQDKRKQALAEAHAEKQKVDADNRQKLIDTESQKLLTLVGEEWKDPKIKDKEINGIYAYAASRGITQEEMSKIVDHRFYLIARDAMKYQELQKSGAAVKKQIKKAPKQIKPGQKSNAAAKKITEVEQRSRASGSVDDAVALMQAKRQR